MTEKLAIQGGPTAIEGGPPTWPIPDEDVRAALEAAYADGDWGRYHGPYCGRLARRLAEYHAIEHVTLCCSGTFAVELALRALGVGAGDEVVLAGYDFPGNFRCAEAVGARPVLVDIDPENWSLDPRQLDAARSERTRAVIVSHLHGGMARMRNVIDWATARGVRVVEDACQSPGAAIDGRMAGTWGDVGVLSFGGSKLLTAGRGGAILARSADVHQRAKVFCERGNQAFPLSELQAAVLLPQLEKLDARNTQRRQSVRRLLEQADPIAALRPLVNRAPGAEPSYYKLAWQYVADAIPGYDRPQFIAAVRAEGVAIDSGFRGFSRRTDRRCRKVGSLQHAKHAAEATLLLHHPVLLEPSATIDRVARAIEKVVRGLAAGL